MVVPCYYNYHHNQKKENLKGQHFLERTCDYTQSRGLSASTDKLHNILVTDFPKSKTYSAKW
jgi:hypothetical protein